MAARTSGRCPARYRIWQPICSSSRSQNLRSRTLPSRHLARVARSVGEETGRNLSLGRSIVLNREVFASPSLPSSSRSCARCGDRFATYGREYLCHSCRKPRAAARMPTRHQLSFRERQIADLIGRARTNKEIAYELCLTEGTVKEYLHHIFRKLNVTNRTELALRWQHTDRPQDASSSASCERSSSGL